MGHQLHGLVVVPVPDGRVHQLRQLEHLQQLGVLGQRGRVQSSPRVDLAATPAELGAARRELGKFGQKVVQTLLHRGELGTWGVDRELGTSGRDRELGIPGVGCKLGTWNVNRELRRQQVNRELPMVQTGIITA